MICDLNTNWPLPYVWNLGSKKEEKKLYKDKIMFALKLLKSLFKKYGNQLSVLEARQLKIENLLNRLDSSKKITETNSNIWLTRPR